MGRAGYGIFDSDSVWDWYVSDLSQMAGVELALVGDPIEDWPKDAAPIMSTEDTKAYLDNGNFDRVFDHLKANRDYWQLCVFLAVCMMIGVTVSKKQLGYIKRIYKKVDPNQMYQGYKQIELALKEYKRGEPYRLRDFDGDGKLLPDLCAKKDAAPIDAETTKTTKMNEVK